MGMRIHNQIKKAFTATLFLLLLGTTPEALNAVQSQSGSQYEGVKLSELTQNFYEADLEMEINAMLDEVTLDEALRHIADSADLKLTYRGDIMSDKKISLQYEAISVTDALDSILDGTGLKYLISRNGYLLITAIYQEISKIDYQDIEINGTVTDNVGNSLPGVSILLEGTGTGVTTDIDGNFTITAPSDGVLIFSYIGYQTLELSIDGRTTLDVVMQSSIADLDELVVTGYAAQRRADITGSVASVNTESLARQTSVSALQRLDGRVSGVTVESGGTPGGRSTVRIRGVSSFQNNEPLYIVDGVPVEDSFMNFLNPNDIEEMQVLKDASASSIYGARASNGVVIIQTKRGQEGRPQVSLDISVGRSTPAHRLDNIVITDPLESAEVARRNAEASGGDFPTWIYGDPQNPSIPAYLWPNDGVNQTMDLSQFNMSVDDYHLPDNIITPASTGTNWFDELHNPAFQQEYNLGISGGDESKRYHVSLNFLDQEGTTAYNRFTRGSIRVNTEYDIGRLTIGENIGFSIDESYGGVPGDNLGEGGVAGRALLVRPIIPIYDVGGWFAGSGQTLQLSDGVNPLKIAWGNKDDKTLRKRIFGNVFARYNFLENLLLNTSLGFNIGENSSKSFSPWSPEGNNPSFSSNMGESFSNFLDWTVTNTLNYTVTFEGNHNIHALGGTEFRQTNSRFLNGGLGDLLSLDLDARFIQPALGDPDQITASSGATVSTLASFFGKIDYNFDERYYLSFTLRRDGSSRFGPDNRWGTFPAASVGWRVSNEQFMVDNDFFTNLMIRVGWGITGNENIPTGRLFDLFGGSTGDTFYDIRGTSDSIVRGFRQSSLGNPNLQWEENETINFGLDAEIMDGRIYLSADVYERQTDNLLFDPSTPATAGVAAPPILNIGKMQNRGFDFEIGYRSQISESLLFSISFIGSHYRNEIIRIDGEAEDFFGPTSARFGTPVINRVGHPIGSFYGLVHDGIFLNQDEVDAHATQDGAAPGRFRFRDVTGDGSVTAADRTVIGDPHPDFTGGLDLTVNYRNWDFSTTIFGTFGNEIFDIQKEYYVFRLFQQNVRRDLLTKSAILENGQVVNPDAEFPRIDETDTFSNQYSSFYVEDGSYVRMRNLQIGYTLPPNIIQSFNNIRIYLRAENLFTITGYSGLDPALPPISAGGPAGDIRDQARGLDRGSVPTPRTFTLGLNINF
jgi:TonB-dependent starch-binding outer membrane protein SusC